MKTNRVPQTQSLWSQFKYWLLETHIRLEHSSRDTVLDFSLAALKKCMNIQLLDLKCCQPTKDKATSPVSVTKLLPNRTRLEPIPTPPLPLKFPLYGNHGYILVITTS